jgi:hypothetical protein
LRTRRQSSGGEWHFFQTTSQIDEAGTCSAVEQEIAVIPTGFEGGATGRWLPLASFSLYNIADDGGLGDLVVCEMKRWCCLVSISTCNTNPPCSLSGGTDGINAGTRDVYPYHWQDQFIPIQDVPSGQYWFVHTINPAGVLIESDYSNNSAYFLIDLNQEATPPTAVILWSDQSMCPAL